MNLDPLTFAFSQISYLITTLSKKNYKQVTQELANIVQTYGLESDRYLLRGLFSLVDFSLDGNRNPSTGNKDGLLTQLLTQECNHLLYKPALVSLLCYAFDHPLHQQKTLKASPHLFPQIRKLLKLTPVQEVVFGLALEHSTNPDIHKLAAQLVKQKLPDLIASYTDADTTRQHEGGLHDTSPEVLHLILTHLTPETAPVLWKRLQRDFPRELVPVVLSPVLYPNSPDPVTNSMEQADGLGAGLLEAGLPSLVPDLGAAFTANVESCKTMLTTLTGGELTPSTVAHTMTAMLLAPPVDNAFFDKPDKPSGDQQWNMEVFVMVVKELYPNMVWRDVVAELDNPKFVIKDRAAFHLLFSGLRLCFEQFQFPVELFYRRWNNSDGQYSLLLQILKNPETFSFADYPFHPVPTESLKASPDSDNKEIATWRSQDLIEILLVLGEHPRLCTQVLELFKLPMQHCPDVLMLGLLQNQAPLNALRQELMTNMVPTFLGMHPNGAVILHAAWNTPAHTVNARSIIMSCMAEWYLRSDNDQARLSRILDIAQDLKALTLILASQVMPFVIDLACLASRRGYLKLDKWLTDRIREHGESFISACVTFLQRRCPQIVSGKEDIPTKGGQLPHDTLTTILGCLQACANNVSKDLGDAIVQMIGNCNVLANKARQPAGVLRHRGLDPFTPFSSSQSLDPLAGLTSTLQGMGLVPGMTMASMSSGLGSLVSTPASPSRIVPTSQSPFPVYVNQNQPLQHQSGTSQVGSLVPRVPAAPGIDKLQINQINQIFGEQNKVLPKEVEDEANSYFQRIYNHPPHATLTIEEVLEKLKKFMESSKQHERDVFNCMLKNLFEEYQFFPQYPDKELLITAQLLGGIIEHGLVNNYMALGIALRYVLDALRKPHGTKMYYFGITALDRFKGRLREFTKYCEHVAGIHHFREFPPHLIAYIDFGLRSESPPSSVLEGSLLPPHLAALLHQPKAVNPAKAVGSALATKGPLSIANATNIDTLLVATEKEEKMISPPDVIQDKIGFIFNNLSQLNLNTKCDEMRELLTKEYWPWISQYLVLKRVTIEVNFHLLYANFLDALKLPELSRMVLMETHRNIKVLLRSDKGIANFSDRSLLKNLGHWLGMLSLAKNKPILMIDIDVKSLIIEAWTKGQQELLYVIPFVAKIMDSCGKSRVFRPTNPWTMAVLNLLAELHQDPNLKLNLKFEIEVLCKNLDTELTKLTPSSLLKDTKRLESIEAQMNKLDNKATTPLSHAMSNVSTTPVKPTAVQPRVEEPPLPMPAPPPPVDVTGVMGGTPGGGTPQPSTTPAIPTPAEPRYHVTDLNAPTFSGLQPHLLNIPPLPIFRDLPQLKTCVRSSVDRAVHEWDSPVTERSIKIAVSTVEVVIRRDFALDPDESRMRNAAYTLMRHLTGSMAMITCRDHMLQSISTNLKNAFTQQMRGASKTQIELAEAAATTIAEANMELACAFIQKLAMEKSCTEIDKKLNDAYEARKQARSEGRRYYDPAMVTYQHERMPEQIRHQVGGVLATRFNSVYGECGKTVPGFLPLTDRDAAVLGPKEMVPPAPTFVPAGPSLPFPDDDTTVLYDKLIEMLDLHLQAALTTGNSPRVMALHGLRETALLARRLRDHASAIALLQKAVEGLMEGYNPRENTEAMRSFRDAHLRALRLLQELPEGIAGPAWTQKHVTRCVSEAREDIKYNIDAIDVLLRSGFINIQQLDELLAQSLENGMNYTAVVFAMQIVQIYLVDERANPIIYENDLQSTINQLVSISSMRRDAPPNLPQVLDLLRVVSDPTVLSDQPTAGPVHFIHVGKDQVRNRDYDDTLPEKTEYLLREWIQAYVSNGRDQTKNFGLIYQQMGFHGVLKSDEMITKFIRLSVELCVNNSHSTRISDLNRKQCYYPLDALIRLIYFLIKYTGDSSPTIRLNLLNKTLGLIVGVLLEEHETRASEFDPMPYQRLLIMLFLELTQSEPFLEALNFQIVTSFCHALYMVRPTKAAKFGYAWLELIAHRSFLTRVMALTSQQKGWPMYSQLLKELFKFLAPFLRNTDLPKSISVLYRGTLRVLLVLLHDFPEFLCDYHYMFCDVIPSNCIQMRNLILSAFPRNMRLPDPFTPNLKVDVLSEISVAPRMVANVGSMITPPTFRKELDSYLKLRAPVTFLSELRGHLQVSKDAGMNYNSQLMNALVLYVGTQAINQIRAQGLSPTMSTIASSSHMDIFQNLGVDLDTEGRYLFLNAIANQLRYPNSHTHYFSCLLLSLFSESNTESIQEQITRVLLERLIVNRPHPWGLLITFIELIKNPIFKFWSHEFVHCAPEIQKLFESVARSCMVTKQSNQANDNEQGEPLAV